MTGTSIGKATQMPPDHLVEQVESMVRRSGRPDNFDGEKWLAEWLAAPNPALAGAAPAEYLDTHEGALVVHQLIAQMESGAYG